MPNSPDTANPAAPADDKPQISDDECLERLAEVVQHHEVAQEEAEPLDEVTRLIGRLAVTIE